MYMYQMTYRFLKVSHLTCSGCPLFKLHIDGKTTARTFRGFTTLAHSVDAVRFFRTEKQSLGRPVGLSSPPCHFFDLKLLSIPSRSRIEHLVAHLEFIGIVNMILIVEPQSFV